MSDHLLVLTPYSDAIAAQLPSGTIASRFNLQGTVRDQNLTPEDLAQIQRALASLGDTVATMGTTPQKPGGPTPPAPA